MVAAGGGDDVALASDLAGEAGYRAGDLVDLTEEEDTGKAAGGSVSLGCSIFVWALNIRKRGPVGVEWW